MKNIIYSFIGLAALVGATSCTQDDVKVPAQDGVTFTVQLPRSVQSRGTFGDGTATGDRATLNNLQFSVYAVNNGVVDATPIFTDSKSGAFVTDQTQETISIPLAKGKSYQVVFYADNSDNTFASFDKGMVSVTYSNASSNVAAQDVFVGASEIFTADKAYSETVTLSRPFAQLNWGSDDTTADAVKGLLSGLTATVSVSSGLYTQYNVLEGNVVSTSEVTTPVEFTPVDMTDLPTQTFPVTVENKTYALIAMNYMLVGEDNIDCKLSFSEANFTPIEVSGAPVQANHRTNIYGSLLTYPGNFNIEVDNNFGEGDENIPTGPTVWDGTTLTEVAPVKQTIDGVEQDVYVASKGSDLAWIAKSINEGSLAANSYIQLDKDIDLDNQPWAPIANVARNATSGLFSGTFDGQGHTVKNLNVAASGDNMGAALIASAENATIKNVNVSGGTLTSDDFAGAILGYSNNCTISNCNSEGLTITASQAAGGILGRAYGRTGDTVTNCTNSSSVKGTSTGTKVGGIVGIVSYGTDNSITGCNNSGDVDAVVGNKSGVAGIVGYVGNPTTISDCDNSGTIGASGPSYTAGVVGYLNGAGPVNINTCTNTGKVTGVISGGIFGMVGSFGAVNIDGSINKGAVEATTTAGGIAGQTGDGLIQNCINTATVTVTTPNAGIAGGIVGADNRGNIYDCQGGSAAITALYAGRILGSSNTGSNYQNELKLVAEGNSYENGLRTVGSMANGTALSTLNVLSGELIGDPVHPGASNSVIIIAEGASWNTHPGETGRFLYYQSTGTWVKQ